LKTTVLVPSLSAAIFTVPVMMTTQLLSQWSLLRICLFLL